MKTVSVSPEAIRDMDSIDKYISVELANPGAAERLVAHLKNAMQSLEFFSERGVQVNAYGASESYRYLICGEYLIFYHVHPESVHIDRVINRRTSYLQILLGRDNEVHDTDL